MKKSVLIFVGCIIISIVLVGCGSKITNNKTNDISNNLQSTQPNTNSQNEKAESKSQQGTEVKMDNNTKVMFNTFFSNFAEINLGFFENSNISDDELFKFGVWHLVNNGYGETVLNNSQIPYLKITNEQILSSIKKYFNKQINIDKFTSSKQFEGHATYKGGYFLVSPGESQEVDFDFALIQSLFDNGNDYYTALINVYNTEDELINLKDNNINLLEPYKNADLDKKLSKVSYKVKAKVHKESDGRYILTEYLQSK